MFGHVVRLLAASIVWARSTAIVVGPTPPGTGVIRALAKQGLRPCSVANRIARPRVLSTSSAANARHRGLTGQHSRYRPEPRSAHENVFPAQGTAPVPRRWSPRVTRTSWPVSRILCTGGLAAPRPAVIHLGLPSPAGSSGLPAGIGRATLDRLRSAPKAGAPLGLAPGGVYRAVPVTRDAGGLLHHRFTLTPLARGGLFSVALSRGSPRVAVSNHPALRSPDFPRRAHFRARRDRPASSSAPSA